MQRYLNPFVDYGFKKLFGTEENKDLLISFLNALLDEEDPIKEVRYKNVEQIGEINGTRTNYFDVYCTTETGHEFIVEMQNSWKPFFKDRTLYYAAKPIRDQGKRGLQEAIDEEMTEEIDKHSAQEDGNVSKPEKKKPWDHHLNDVYLVAVMNFSLPNKEYPEDSYLHKIKLVDIEDFHVFYEKLTLIYLEMPKLNNVRLDLSTMRGKWLYALHILSNYDYQPKELREGVFEKLFRQAELAQFTPEQDLAYERSQKVYWDTYNEINGAKIIGHQEGLAEGKELGLAEGKELGLAEGKLEALKETARNLLSMGMDMEKVLLATGLSKEELDQ